jgi:hypothetical protein
MINHPAFYCNNKDTYPPFKEGLYLEEHFFTKMRISPPPDLKRRYIPALWTNFQIEHWFESRKNEMQKALDEWINLNPSPGGYFTIVQYDDGPLLNLPANTVVYGACSGNVPLPLIYEDKQNKLEQFSHKTFAEKNILCSFVGNITSNTVQPNVREIIFNMFQHRPQFQMINAGGWTASVNKQNQDTFINTTLNTKFAFAPRGYGRSSFRFFECFKLGTIPIYVWNDINWLPFQDQIDYSKCCISLHVSELATLEQKLLSITENDYMKMLEYYQTIKHFFTLEGMSDEIIRLNT